MRNSDDLASQCIEHVIKWLNGSIDEYDNEKGYYYYNNYLAMDSQDLKEKIDLFMEEGIDEF
tara:strand:+ start:541 stop:726 length:186 start_codon:yes stop_codon:yes gene_type:complete